MRSIKINNLEYNESSYQSAFNKCRTKMENVFLKIINESKQKQEFEQKKRCSSHLKRDSIALAEAANIYISKGEDNRTRKLKLTTRLLSTSNERNLSINNEYKNKMNTLEMEKDKRRTKIKTPINSCFYKATSSSKQSLNSTEIQEQPGSTNSKSQGTQRIQNNKGNLIFEFQKNNAFSNVISKEIKGIDLKSFSNNLIAKDKMCYHSNYDTELQKLEPPRKNSKIYDIILHDRFCIRPKTSTEYSLFDCRSSPKKKKAIIDLSFIRKIENSKLPVSFIKSNLEEKIQKELVNCGALQDRMMCIGQTKEIKCQNKNENDSKISNNNTLSK